MQEIQFRFGMRYLRIQPYFARELCYPLSFCGGSVTSWIFDVLFHSFHMGPQGEGREQVMTKHTTTNVLLSNLRTSVPKNKLCVIMPLNACCHLPKFPFPRKNHHGEKNHTGFSAQSLTSSIKGLKNHLERNDSI